MERSLSHWLLDGLSIVLIDVLLAGDNALVIALAVRSLPPKQRRIGSILGAAAAVTLRIAITFAAAQILGVEFIKLVGGAFVVWIAVKVFVDAESSRRNPDKTGSFLQAIWFIVVADITMSMDNVLAIAGASKGSLPLMIFGLCMSIPFVVISSNLLIHVINRYPFTLYLGAAILGKVGAEMMLTDGFVSRTLHPSQAWIYAGEAIAVAGVLIASRLIRAKGETPSAGRTKPGEDGGTVPPK